jgi:anti-sigma-K factor RskA
MDDSEGLAAEYVLGTLPLEERAEAERLIARDQAFAALVEGWQNRLAPLNDAYEGLAPPPGVLDRVEARLFPAPARTRFGFWSGVAGAVAALGVAALVLVAVLPESTVPPTLTATLKGEGQSLVVAAAWNEGAETLTVTRSAGPAAQEGRDYQLWVIPAGAAPIPLGLLRDAPLEVELAELPAGTTLAVSLEPAGGSPTGQPTGPVLVAAVIES